jgi:hypothetical protein
MVRYADKKNPFKYAFRLVKRIQNSNAKNRRQIPASISASIKVAQWYTVQEGDATVLHIASWPGQISDSQKQATCCHFLLSYFCKKKSGILKPYLLSATLQHPEYLPHRGHRRHRKIINYQLSINHGIQPVPFLFQYAHFYHTPPGLFIPKYITLNAFRNKAGLFVTFCSRFIIIINTKVNPV